MLYVLYLKWQFLMDCKFTNIKLDFFTLFFHFFFITLDFFTLFFHFFFWGGGGAAEEECRGWGCHPRLLLCLLLVDFIVQVTLVFKLLCAQWNKSFPHEVVLFEPLFLYAVTGEYFTFDFEKKMKQSCSETCENVPRVRYYFLWAWRTEQK